MKRTLVFRVVFGLGFLACVIWFVAHPSAEVLVAAIPIAVGFLGTVERFGSTPNVQGIWAYHVTSEGTTFSHAGRCRIEQDGQRVKIHGHRYLTCIHCSSEISRAEVDWTWETSWAEVSEDNVLRFDYSITVKDGGDANDVKGICRIRRQSAEDMSGSYHMLPPFSGESPNAQWGTISFKKLPATATLSRPPGGYDADGNERQELAAAASMPAAARLP